MNSPQGSLPPELETAVNALIDGELDAAEAAELKRRAEQDPVLAQAIIGAWRLQCELETLRLEPAPATLTRKLREIPRRHGAGFVPRWVAAMALASLALVAVTILVSLPRPEPGSAPRQVENAENAATADEQLARQARADLAVAFAYIDRIGFRTAREVQEVLDAELAEPVRANLSRHMPFTAQHRKENHS